MVRWACESAMTKLPEKTKAALVVLRKALGIHDVRTDGKTIWLMSGPRSLKRTLGPRGTIRTWLYATTKPGYTLDSYAENAITWDGLETAVRWGLEEAGIKKFYRIVPVPTTKGLPRKTWSARTQKWVPAIKRQRFRFCDVEPVWGGRADGPVLLKSSRRLPPLMLSHGISLKKMPSVRRCGGLLWPSFALSWRVPPRFGDVMFFGSVDLVTGILKPTGKPKRNMYLAGTDIWSPDARELMHREKAIEHELAGNVDFFDGELPREKGGWGRRDLQNYFLVENQQGTDLVGSMSTWDHWEITEPIKNRNQLNRRMQELMSVYAKGSDPYVYPERDPNLSTSTTPYPYGELKIVGRVELRDLPLVVYPGRVRRSVEKLLDDMGFQGVRITVPWEGPLYDQNPDEVQRAAYAGMVTAAVLNWSLDPCNTRGARIGNALRLEGSWRSEYQPVSNWESAKSSYQAWQHGYCGTKNPGNKRLSRMSKLFAAWVRKKVEDPGRIEFETQAGRDALEEMFSEHPDIVQDYRDKTVARLQLSAYDARVANDLDWFGKKVQPGETVLVVDRRRNR